MKVNDPNEAERFHVGTTIAGRYLVERPIGEGAMGAVALARHVSLDEKVAIKFLRPELRRDPVAIARLSREAKALARIKSDHVARVLDVGVTLSVGPYMVMEYLEGTDLGDLIESEGPLTVERAVECMLQVCEALTVAHTAGITHRDIKPQNLFLARHGQFETLKVLDFGIAEDGTGSGASESSVGPPSGERSAAALYGTPSYMSPERVKNDPSANHRSDIWSLGVVLHEMVTGRAVFDAPSLTETCARVVSDAPLDLEMDDAVLPPSLRSIIARCLERDPEQRYQSVEELTAALAPLATMQERFRGRSTGAFSRKLVEEALARSKTQRLPIPKVSAEPPAPGELSLAMRNGLREIGAGVRAVARALPLARIYDRPVWLFAAVALASALVVLLVASVMSDVQWMTPPPVAVQAEPARDPSEGGNSAGSNSARNNHARVSSREASSALVESQTSLAPPLAGALIEDSAALRAEGTSPIADEPTPPSAAATRRPAERVTPSRRQKRSVIEASAQTRAASEPVSDTRLRLVTERGSRVRLVQDKLMTNHPQSPAPDVSGDTNPGRRAPKSQTETKPPPASKAKPLPDWLEAIKPKPSPREEGTGRTR